MHVCVCIMRVCAHARACVCLSLQAMTCVAYILTYACMHVGPMHYVGMHE